MISITIESHSVLVQVCNINLPLRPPDFTLGTSLKSDHKMYSSMKEKVSSAFLLRFCVNGETRDVTLILNG